MCVGECPGLLRPWIRKDNGRQEEEEEEKVLVRVCVCVSAHSPGDLTLEKPLHFCEKDP